MDSDLIKMKSPPVCWKCHKKIFDGTILKARGQFYHSSCIQCAVCQTRLDGFCHFKDNAFFCRDDFIRTFGAKCAGCGSYISPSENVNAVNTTLYHSACFTCCLCMCKLLPGQYFYVREDARLVCSGDYQKMMHDEISDSESESDESGSDDSNASDRINIQDNQLRMFLDAYKSNKRPNKATLQYLGQSAGLKTRSVQIWFQNRRAKDRSIERNRQKIMSGQTMFNMRQNCLEEHKKSQHCWNQNPYFDSKSLGVNHKQEQKFTLASTDKGSLIRNEQSPACSDTDSSYNEYQLYCPLDYLLPNEMPPNVDLSSADICNGEVITDKLRSGNIKFGQTHAADNHSGSRSWIAL